MSPHVSHNSLKPRVKADRLIHVDLPREVLLEAVQLLAEVFLYHGEQRDFKILQLVLQRGQLSGLLEGDGRGQSNRRDES